MLSSDIEDKKTQYNMEGKAEDVYIGHFLSHGNNMQICLTQFWKKIMPT